MQRYIVLGIHWAAKCAVSLADLSLSCVRTDHSFHCNFRVHIVLGLLLNEFLNYLHSIVALDPAGPLYVDPLDAQVPLSCTDAVNVFVLHTDAGIFGYPWRAGTIDFWPNDGHSVQPGCSCLPSPDEGLLHREKKLYPWIVKFL